MENSFIASVIVPMRNEEKYIGGCLDSILANDFPYSQYELLVVDGCSTDGSPAIVKKYMERFSHIRLIDNPARIVPTGLNLAIRRSSGKYVIRMDAHAQYPKNYLSACVRELDTRDAEIVGGHLITLPGSESFVGKAIALMTQHPFGVGNSGFRIGRRNVYVDTVPFGAFRRDLFERIGLFQETLVRHQDFELNARVRAAGGKIFLASDIEATYYNVPTFKKFVRQAYTNGIWLGRAWIRYPVCFCWRHAAPLALVMGLLLPLLMASVFPAASLLSKAILFSYLLLAITAAIQIASSKGLKFFFLLPVLFSTYHLVYGLSTVFGLLSFSALPKERPEAEGIHLAPRRMNQTRPASEQSARARQG